MQVQRLWGLTHLSKVRNTQAYLSQQHIALLFNSLRVEGGLGKSCASVGDAKSKKGVEGTQKVLLWRLPGSAFDRLFGFCQAHQISRAQMSKPQWKIDLEAKERAVQEREEAEKKAKAQKLASLGHASESEPVAPIHISEVR